MKKITNEFKRVNGNRRGLLIAALCSIAGLTAMAQGTEPVSVDATGVAGVLGGFARQHAWVATVLLVIGGLRVVVKPVMSVIDSYVKNSCSPEEYDRLRSFEAGPVYRWISFGLDLVGSIKLPVIGIKPSQGTDAGNK